jgi:hypothetical protein
MMPSNQTMKVTPKQSEAVIPDDPRVGIGLNTVSEPGGSRKNSCLSTFIHQKLLQQHQQQQAVSLDELMMTFQSVLTRTTSA